MLKYLADQFGDRATQGDKSQVDFIRDEAKRLEMLIVSDEVVLINYYQKD